MKSIVLMIILMINTTIIVAQTLDEINSSSGLQKASLELNYCASRIASAPSECIPLLEDALIIGKSTSNTQVISAAQILLAKAYYETGKYSESFKIGEEAIQNTAESDKNYSTLINLVGSAAKQSKNSKATEYLAKSYNLDPTPNKALEIASLYAKKKEYSNSIKWYDKAINSMSDPTEKTDALISKALVTANYGNNEEAQSILDKASETATSSQQTVIDGYQSDIETNQVAQESAISDYQDDLANEQEALVDKIKSLNAMSLDEIEKLNETNQLIQLKIKAQADDYEKKLLEEKNLTQQANFKLQEEKLLNEKIAAENQLISAKNRANEEAIAKQRFQIGLLVAVIVGLGGIGGLLLIGFRNKRKHNKVLTKKNLEITEKSEKIQLQKEQIEKQHSDIAESLEYAKQIQKAVLPSTEKLLSASPNSFVYLRPRDYVSGDFFWYDNNPERQIIVAADCTGHGVPGAFMSIIFTDILNKLIVERGLSSPAEILLRTSEELTKMIRQNETDEDFKGGMDCAIILIDNDNNLTYCGARNPLYIVRNNDLIELKGTKRSISVIPESSTRKIKEFTNQEYKLQDEDVIYMFSDGFADQKGGAAGKKYFYPPFRDLLKKLPLNNNMDMLPDVLNEEFDTWRGNNEQYDDVLIFGMEIESKDNTI